MADRSGQSGRELMMLNDPISRVIPRMAVPTIIAFLINSIYSLADTYFVSSLGTNATAAVSVNSALDQIIMMCGSMLALGANSYVARLLGAQRKDKANRVLSTAFFLAMGLGAALLVVGTAFMTPMVRLLGATDTCLQYSIDYATYVLLAAPVMSASFVMNQCLRAEGAALMSMIGMGFGGILNVFLDPVFIFGLNLGVKGASIATAISKLVSFCILIFPYLTGRSLLKLRLHCVHFERDILGEIVTVGMPSMLRSGLAVVAGILLNNLAGNISDSVLAGIGVCTKVMMFPFGVVLGFGSGFQPVAGFNWGAERYDRVEESYFFAAKMAVIGGAVMGLVLGIFAPQVITLFSETDPEMQAIGSLAIRLQCLALPAQAWVAVVNMYCAGLGYAGYAFLLATSRQGTCFLPILYPLAHFFGAKGLASVQAVADILSVFLALPVIRRMLKIVRKRRAEKEAGVPSLQTVKN